jgi:hypothetical protein
MTDWDTTSNSALSHGPREALLVGTHARAHAHAHARTQTHAHTHTHTCEGLLVDAHATHTLTQHARARAHTRVGGAPPDSSVASSSILLIC